MQGVPKVLVGKLYENNLAMKLATMNDGEGKTFPEIADWIEENL